MRKPFFVGSNSAASIARACLNLALKLATLDAAVFYFQKGASMYWYDNIDPDYVLDWNDFHGYWELYYQPQGEHRPDYPTSKCYDREDVMESIAADKSMRRRSEERFAAMTDAERIRTYGA